MMLRIVKRGMVMGDYLLMAELGAESLAAVKTFRRQLESSLAELKEEDAQQRAARWSSLKFGGSKQPFHCGVMPLLNNLKVFAQPCKFCLQ